MESLAAHALAAVIVLVVAVAAAYVWYHAFGWKAFTFSQAAGAAAPSWTPASGASGSKGVDSLRFRKAVFTVTESGGTVHTADVTAALNAMAVGFKGAASAPAALTLVRPLNPYSFVIPSVNDSSVTDGATADPLAGATASITGYYRTI
jgi:hypothetical protein